MLRTLAAPCALLFALCTAPAFAKPVVIAQLGTAPLLGQITSTKALKADFGTYQTRLRRAAGLLGITPAEYSAFQEKLAASEVTWVVVPRHLDAMTWASGNRVYVLHDVVIPANTNGWEIDVRRGSREVALFIPARCGNLSVVRKTLPVIAREPVPTPRPVQVAAAPPPPPPPPPEFKPVPPPADTIVHPGAVSRHASLLPLLGGLLFFFGGGSGPSVPGLPPPICLTHF